VIRHRLTHLLALAVVLTTLLLSARPAAADIQKSGPEVFPGKFSVGFHPIGVQAAFDSRSTGGYKLDTDFAGMLKSTDKVSLWLGGGLSYAHPSYSCGVAFAGCGNDIGFRLFVRITLEKLLKIPLVPYVEAGVGGEILYFANVPNGFANTGGAVPLRVGGGIHYFLLKNLGVGMETNFAFGPGIYPAVGGTNCGGNNTTCIGFYGHWDMLLGELFAF
jgi:hypothetical protein